MENNQRMAKADKTVIGKVMDRIVNLQNRNEIAFPQNYNPRNALTSAWMKIQQTKDKNSRPVLEVCTKDSIANALFETVVQGLNPMKNQCYYIAYGDQLTMSPSYFGIVAQTKALRPEVKEVYADVVYAKDTFKYEKRRGKTVITQHEQELTNIDKNKIIAAYCTVILDDGSEQTTIMTFEDIKRSWQHSRTKPVNEDGTLKRGTVHAEHPDEMAKKTVTKRACKAFINSSDDSTLKTYITQASDEAVDSRLEAEIEENSSINDVDTNDPPAPIIDVDPNTGEVVNEISAELPIGTDPY